MKPYNYSEVKILSTECNFKKKTMLIELYGVYND